MNKATLALQTQNANLTPSSLTPPRQGILQRKCACGSHTSGGGKCKECAAKKGVLQRKLTIGASNDLLEQEADRVADQVMSTPLNSAINRTLPKIQRFTGQTSDGLNTAPPSVERVLASSGRPLEPALRQDMEQRFGHDFSQVRVHTGSTAEQSAREVNARAYTVGYNVVFSAGQFVPETHDGQRLIAHELTHVVQQAGSNGTHIRQGDEKRGRFPIIDQVSMSIPIDVVGVNNIHLARVSTPANPPRNFEGAMMITVDLPPGTGIPPNRLGFEKDFHGYLPSNIVEDHEKWHASHSVGRNVGAELEEGILLAPRGVNLSIQKGIENHIAYLRDKIPEDAHVRLKLEITAHPNSRRLAKIVYQVELVRFDGQSMKAFTATVNVSNNVQRPTANVNVEGVSGEAAGRDFADAKNIRRESRRTPRPEDKLQPLRPRSKAPATYSATNRGIKRHEVPDTVVSSRWPKSSSAGTATTTKNTNAGISPSSILQAPAAPKAESPQLPTKATPQANNVKTASPESVAALAGLAEIAQRYAKSTLEDFSVGKARFEALSDFTKNQDEIFSTLWNSPGQGMNVEFLFMLITPKNDQPARLKYLGMGTLQSERPRKVTYIGLSKTQLMEIQELKASPGLVVNDNIVVNMWIKPVQTLRHGEATENSLKTEVAPTFITSKEDFIHNTASLYKGDMFNYELSAYELLKQSLPTLTDGYLASVEGRKLKIANPVHDQLLTYYTNRVHDQLAKRLKTLGRKMEFYSKRLEDRLEEDYFSKIINQRGDIPLNPKMFEYPRSHIESAKGTIANGAYRHAHESLDQADALLSQAEAWLFRYDKGYFPAWYDSIQ